MRIVPILTALVVTALLYFAVIERDTLLAFARGETPDAQTEDAPVETADTAEAAPVDTAVADAAPTLRVVVQRSEAEDIGNAVLVRGQTEADRQVEVRAETTARVISEPLRRGTFVEEGQLLCQLDEGVRAAQLARAKAGLSEAQSRVPEAEARLAEAQARLEEARINDNAATQLSTRGFSSDTRVAQTAALVSAANASIAAARAGVESARSGIEAAAAEVAAAEREIDNLTIEAPFSGLLESDTAELGSLMQPGALCATVIRLNPIKIVGYIPETEVAKVQVGAPAKAQLATGQEVSGIVTFISRSADPTTRTFQVDVSVANDDLSIRDGQTADIAISAEGIKAHLLPGSALTLDNSGALGVRVVEDAGLVGFVPVTIVRDTTAGVWVTGLGDAADVIVMGQDFVTSGVTVEPTYREARK